MSAPNRAFVGSALIDNKELDDLVTLHARQFFSTIGIPSEFLEFDVDTWHGNDTYNTATYIVCTLLMTLLNVAYLSWINITN